MYVCVHTCYVESQAFIYLEKIRNSPLMDTEGEGEGTLLTYEQGTGVT